jgi:hypothetical protein
MDNVQNCDSYINIPSSQSYRSHSPNISMNLIPNNEGKIWNCAIWDYDSDELSSVQQRRFCSKPWMSKQCFISICHVYSANLHEVVLWLVKHRNNLTFLIIIKFFKPLFVFSGDFFIPYEYEDSFDLLIYEYKYTNQQTNSSATSDITVD